MNTNSRISIRAFSNDDYANAISLWSRIDGLNLNESDTPEAIHAFLERNPGFSAAAVTESGELIGAVLCGHNGRSSLLYHLAVATEYRSRGIANQLVEFCFAKLAAVNIPRCSIFVYTANEVGNSFWLKNGWNDPTTWKVMQKQVEPLSPPKK